MTRPATEIKRVLELAVARERGASEFYAKAAEDSQDNLGQRMFRWLAEQELGHLKYLSGVRRELVKGRQWKTGAGTKAFFDPITKEQLPRPIEVRGTAKPDAGEYQAVHLGQQSERESIAFYSEAAAQATDPAARDMFTRLSAVEQGHLTLLETQEEWLDKVRTLFVLPSWRG